MGESGRLFQIFSERIRRVLEEFRKDADGIEEVRIRAGAPLFVICRDQEYMVGAEAGFRVSAKDVEETLQCAARYSLYAYEEELRQGFLTVQGGHRIGVAGRVVAEGGRIRTIQPVTFLNVRFAHQVCGCADGVMPFLLEEQTGNLRNTLFISPPRCGKTTLLRDVIRQVSDGVPVPYGAAAPGSVTVPNGATVPGSVTVPNGATVPGSVTVPNGATAPGSVPVPYRAAVPGGLTVPDGDSGERRRSFTVGVVDERSEIAACFQGIPQNDVGVRTDVLDGCPKALGMMLLIRSMAPEVVAVDEIGSKEDLDALRYVMNCGCRILATVHGTSMEDIEKKPGLGEFLRERRFERYVVLGNARGPGTVRNISDGSGNCLYHGDRRNAVCG